MIKDIVVSLSTGAAHDFAGEFAISVAKTFDAHVAAIAFSYEPMIRPPIPHSMVSKLLEGYHVETEEAAKAALTRFEHAARQAGLSAESRMITMNIPGATDLFGRIASRFDISVIGQTEPDRREPQNLIIEGVLFKSGRPVLIVPYTQKSGFKLDRVILCWDGSSHASRAIADALPFLARARAADLVIVAGEPAKSDEMPGADIAQHLARHGLRVDVKRILVPNIDVTSAILNHAADTDADLIVMGAYGHSRLREFILGGATRGMLDSMTVPVLMSH